MLLYVVFIAFLPGNFRWVPFCGPNHLVVRSLGPWPRVPWPWPRVPRGWRSPTTEALWALSDCTELNGATRLIPGSHLRTFGEMARRADGWLDGMMDGGFWFGCFGWLSLQGVNKQIN